MSRPLLLAAALLACLPMLLATPAPDYTKPTPGPSGVPAFPDLLPKNFPNRDKWNNLGKTILYDFLIKFDSDFVDASGRPVPPGFPGAAKDENGTLISQPKICGRVARLWIRMPFHDCGTYDAYKGKGGCNGSLRRELPIVNPAFDSFPFTLFLGNDSSRADFLFTDNRIENTGFSFSVAFFYKAKFDAEKFGLYASWADVMVYSGLLSLAVCNGPHVLFVPGRVDADADGFGLLPAPSDNLDGILGAYHRMGLGSLDGMTVQSSHTCACFSMGCMDDTPNTYDNHWAKGLAYYNPDDSSNPPICDLTAARVESRCIAPFDLEYTKNPVTRGYLKLLASETRSYAALQAMTYMTAGKYEYGGFLDNVDLCDYYQVCPKDQFAYFTLSASSWFRLTSLGLPKKWVGWKYATKKSGQPKDFGLELPKPDNYNDDVEGTIKGWQVTKKAVEKVTKVAKDAEQFGKYLGKI